MVLPFENRREEHSSEVTRRAKIDLSEILFKLIGSQAETSIMGGLDGVGSKVRVKRDQ